MGFRRRQKRDSDSENEDKKEEAEPEPEIPPDFHNLLEELIPILKFLSFAASASVFRASPQTRVLLSCMVKATLTFETVTISSSDMDPPQKAAEKQRRVQRTRVRLPQCSAADFLPLHLKCKLAEVPLRRAAMNRGLGRLMPMVKWEEIPVLRVRTRDQIGLLDTLLFNSIGTLQGTDVLSFLEDPEYFRHVTRLTLTLPQMAALPEDVALPQVTRIKLVCQDIALADTALERLGQVFPNMNRLHLSACPVGLLPLCGPGFSAPKDLRLTLDSDNHAQKEANVFVVSHLLSLPFSWGDSLFRNVVRLQMHELNEDHAGLAFEQLGSTIKALPALRRLGTVSMRMAQQLDITSDDFKLEELVLVIEIDDAYLLFKMLIPLEQRKSRCSLKRLALHCRARDGVSRLKPHLEDAVCGGIHNIATKMLHENGVLVFSVAEKQLLESPLAQLCWFDPIHFNLDAVDYGYDRLPVSTPLERSLVYWGTDTIVQPNGTLVSGPLRPNSEKEPEEPLSPKSPQSPHKRGKKPQNQFAFVGMNMVDIFDTLLLAAPV